MDSPFLSMILLWGCNFAPNGWAFCQGQLLAISQNAALFSLLGTTFGGNGTTNFGLPDFRGRIPVGAGQGPGLSTYVLGQPGGAESVTLNVNQIPAHLHPVSLSLTISVSNAAGSNSTPAANNSLAAMNDPDSGDAINGYGTGSPNTPINTGATASGNTGATGGSQPHTNIQPYLTVNYIIALAGIFPSRG
jgi:microcystin-dependent protein